MQIVKEHFFNRKIGLKHIIIIKIISKLFLGFHYICEENYLYDAENEYCDLPERVNCEWR